ncbi:MAG: GvpL/GvpF family gas vesicle protein [Elusimicrobia bacterium]|nr:GvpL/GvpF family gas vesicle protein [Elusimicrobiota bacterium]
MGKYIYGIIQTNGESNFGPIGIGGRGDEVHTVAYKDLSAVISNSPAFQLAVNRENLMNHQKTLEAIMERHTVLPIKFGTVAANAEGIRRLLEREYAQLKQMLHRLEGRVELGVKAVWKDMNRVFQEVVDEDQAIRDLKQEILEKPGSQTYTQKISIGQMIQSALDVKKETETDRLLKELKRVSVEYRLNPTIGDKMILNAAFLLDREKERVFDGELDRLDAEHGGRIRFLRVGPVPPYNFVSLTLHSD